MARHQRRGSYSARGYATTCRSRRMGGIVYEAFANAVKGQVVAWAHQLSSGWRVSCTTPPMRDVRALASLLGAKGWQGHGFPRSAIASGTSCTPASQQEGQGTRGEAVAFPGPSSGAFPLGEASTESLRALLSGKSNPRREDAGGRSRATCSHAPTEIKSDAPSLGRCCFPKRTNRLVRVPRGTERNSPGLTRRLPGEPVVRAAQLSRQRVERQPRRRPGAA